MPEADDRPRDPDERHDESRSVERDRDLEVVGLAALSRPAAFRIARSGTDVLGLEQIELGHPDSASQDHSRSST